MWKFWGIIRGKMEIRIIFDVIKPVLARKNLS